MTVPLATLIELYELLSKDGVNAKQQAKERLKEIITQGKGSPEDLKNLESEICV